MGPPPAAVGNPSDLLDVQVEHVAGGADDDPFRRAAVGRAVGGEEPAVLMPRRASRRPTVHSLICTPWPASSRVIRRADHLLSSRSCSIRSTTSGGIWVGEDRETLGRSWSPGSPCFRELQGSTPDAVGRIHVGSRIQQPRHRSHIAVLCRPRQLIRYAHTRIISGRPTSLTNGPAPMSDDSGRSKAGMRPPGRNPLRRMAQSRPRHRAVQNLRVYGRGAASSATAPRAGHRRICREEWALRRRSCISPYSRGVFFLTLRCGGVTTRPPV